MNTSLINKRFLFTPGSHFAQCHASTLVKNDDGSLVYACFGGTREGHDDVGIHIFRRVGYDVSYIKEVKVSDVPHFNPVLYRRRDGRIFCWFKVGKTIPEWRTWQVVSCDGGVTWSDPVPLGGNYAPVKNKPVRLKNGVLCAPYSVETMPDPTAVWTVIGSVSYDDGGSFVIGGRIEYTDKPDINDKRSGVIQPSVWQDDEGVHMLMRSTWGKLWRADSHNGLDWGRAYAVDIPNNNSGIDLVRMPSGVLALVMNPVSGDFAARTPLTLNLSRDGGATWDEALVLEDAPGEYSYPAVIADGNVLHICYTFNRVTICACEVEVNK